EHRVSYVKLAADKGDQIDATRLDVGPDCSRRNCFQAERGRMFGDLLALDQRDLPSACFPCRLADTSKIPGIALNTLAFNQFDRLHAVQRLASLLRMQMQRCNFA